MVCGCMLNDENCVVDDFASLSHQQWGNINTRPNRLTSYHDGVVAGELGVAIQNNVRFRSVHGTYEDDRRSNAREARALGIVGYAWLNRGVSRA